MPLPTVTIAEVAHLDPTVCDALRAGYFNASDVRRLGLGMLVLTIVLAILVLPCWSLLSLPLVTAGRALP